MTVYERAIIRKDAMEQTETELNRGGLAKSSDKARHLQLVKDLGELSLEAAACEVVELVTAP